MDVLKSSAEKMRGEKGRLIGLLFRFIGWQALGLALLVIARTLSLSLMIAVAACLNGLLGIYIFMAMAVFARQILCDTSPEEPDLLEEKLANSFSRLSNRVNRCEGMRCNPALDVLGGTSPADRMPVFQESAEEEEAGAEYDGGDEPAAEKE